MRYEDVTGARSDEKEGAGGRRGSARAFLCPSCSRKRCVIARSAPRAEDRRAKCVVVGLLLLLPTGRNEVHKFPGRSRLQRVISWNSKNSASPTMEQRRHQDDESARRARKMDKKRLARRFQRVVGNASASRDTNYATDTQDVKFRAYERAGLLNFSSTCPPIKIAAAHNYLLISRRARDFRHFRTFRRAGYPCVIRKRSLEYILRSSRYVTSEITSQSST